MKKIFLLLALLSTQAFSASYVFESGTLERVYPLSNGDFILTFHEGSPDCTNGSDPKYHYVREGVAGVTENGLKAMLSVALSAGLANKQLTISFDKDSSTCDVRRLSISL